MRLRDIACALLLALSGAACLPVFENPLPVAPDMKPDPALIGTWASTDEDDKGGQVSFFPLRDGWLDILHVSDADGTADSVDVMRYRGYTAEVEGDRFLCLRTTDPAGGDAETNGYLIVRFTVEPSDALAIQLFDPNAVRALIETNKLEGVIKDGMYADEIRVTSSSVRLLSVLLSEGVDAFVSTNVTLRYTRMRAAP